MEPVIVQCVNGSLSVGDAHGGLVQLTVRVPTADLCLLLTPNQVQELLAALIAGRRESGGYPWS
jgi:hypothetical protein